MTLVETTLPSGDKMDITLYKSPSPHVVTRIWRKNDVTSQVIKKDDFEAYTCAVQQALGQLA